jgi:phage terminase large subunit GpA-like protein
MASLTAALRPTLLEVADRLLTAPQTMTPDRWAAANRFYPPSAALPGPRDPYLTPYIVGPERVATEGRTKRVVLVTASQAGKTELMLDLCGQRLDQKPAPILYVGPNKQFLTEQFEPRVMALLDEAPTLAGKVSRGKRMTKTRKVVGGVPFRLAHAGSSASLKSDPAALALVDEYDQMLKNIQGQGDPLGLVERRGDTYAEFVCVVTSTPSRGMVHAVRDKRTGLDFWGEAPTEDVESPIWRLWQTGTRHHWAWPCPHCGGYFIPRFELARWPRDATPDQAATSAWLECPNCGGVFEDRHKAAANARGHYIAPGQSIDRDGIISGDPPATTTVSFWVSGFASPFVTIGERVKSYLEALLIGDDAMIQTAMSAGFGELYAQGGRDIREWQQVAKRKTAIRAGEVPLEVFRLTCAVDVQATGFFYSVRGWGARATSWQIESDEIAGHTNEPEVWGDLSHLLMAQYGGLPISLMLVDTGFRPDKPNEGWNNQTYQFCRRFSRVLATKGFATLQSQVMRSRVKVTVPGQAAPVLINLCRLDTDFWKLRLHERLAWPEDQPGGFHLNADATEDYCRQLVSEVRKVLPNGKPEWVRISRRNHYLDVEAMNEAAGHMLNAARIPIGATRAAGPPREPEPDASLVEDLDPAAAGEAKPQPPPPPPTVSAEKLMADIARGFKF